MTCRMTSQSAAQAATHRFSSAQRNSAWLAVPCFRVVWSQIPWTRFVTVAFSMRGLLLLVRRLCAVRARLVVAFGAPLVRHCIWCKVTSASILQGFSIVNHFLLVSNLQLSRDSSDTRGIVRTQGNRGILKE